MAEPIKITLEIAIDPDEWHKAYNPRTDVTTIFRSEAQAAEDALRAWYGHRLINPIIRTL